MSKFLSVLLPIVGILLFVTLIVVWPLLAITAINTLFGTNIPFTVLNWFAMTFLGVFFRGVKKTFNKE